MNHTHRRVALLGSTGSIGRQTLDVIRAYPDRFQVLGLAAGRNVSLLAEQVAEFGPQLVSCESPDAIRDVLGTAQIASLEEIATHPDVDIVVSAVVGKDGLAPALAALRAGKTLALANKEAMVMAGPLMREAALAGGGEIRPVDSEHSALWQCLAGEEPDSVRRLILTASGGALRDLAPDDIAKITPEQALAHPTWTMGPRVTIDSASLFNKGLEVIEARWLFDIPFERIDVLLHRESIVHSMVETVDGSIKAQLSNPDMRLPIQYALTYPERFPLDLPAVDFAALGKLNFGPIDMERYPCLALALAAGTRGGTYPAAIAAADEVAVASFIEGSMRFLDIPALLADTLETHTAVMEPNLEAIMEADTWARRYAEAWIKDRN